MINDDMTLRAKKDDELRHARTSPTGNPKADFQKVMGKEQREESGKRPKNEIVKGNKEVKKGQTFEDVSERIDGQNMAPKSKGVSLFDLAGKSDDSIEAVTGATDEEGISATELTEEIKQGSLIALQNNYGLKEKLAQMQEDMGSWQLEKNPVVDFTHAPIEDLSSFRSEAKNTPSSDKEDSNLKFLQEQPDIASIIPRAQALEPTQHTAIQAPQQPASAAAQMKEVVDQIMNKLYTINTSGKTETLIQLARPPMFAGASVIITSFKTAKGEFNITFENLTQAAKKILDMTENQNSLKSALTEKGYTVHIVTTTTLAETTNFVEGKGPEKEKEQSDNKSKNRQNKNEKQEDES